MNLKYLFTAEFADGSVLKQNADDVSGIDPQRSAFFDCLQKMMPITEMKDGAEVVTGYANPIKTFSMSDGVHTFLVDFKDGHFEADGTKFFMHDGLVKGFQLVFFRRHQHHINQDIKNGQFVGEGQEIGHTIAYHFGWHGIDEKGGRVQRVMVLA